MDNAAIKAQPDRILIVDDAPANLKLLTDILIGQGYNVHPASDGELALEFVQSILPDLVLLDIRMPGMDGYEVCRRLKANPRTSPIPVIFVSILEDECNLVEAFRAGAVDYVSKPIRREEVLARIRTHLHLRDLTLRLEQKVDERTAELALANRHLLDEIEERKRAEEALRAKTAELDRYFTNALDLLCIADTEGFFRRLNPAWESTLGYSLSELEGRSFLDLVHPDDMEATREAISRLREQKEVLNFSNRYRNKNGSYHWIEWRSYPSGKEIYAVARDITERKRAEEEIRQLNQELEQRVADRTAQLEAANKELEAFAYSVSHDLRAPLRHIDGYLELLQERAGKTLDQKCRHYMACIIESAKKMGQLIDDLLSFSRMGRQSMLFTTVDLGCLVRDVIQDFEPDTAGRSIAWCIGDLPPVRGDASMLRVVLFNLIANALKFTRSRVQAQIEIGSLPGETSEAVIFVSDNGVGFDMTYVDKLFGVFQRLHRADEFEGTGIGLANVRRIIARHGGRTWAKGAPDGGAAFYFALQQASRGGFNA